MGCVLLLLVSSVILFLQFLSEMSMGNLDIFCGSVCRDHVADAIVLHPDHAARDAPVFNCLTTASDFIRYRNGEIGADVADIGEVEWCFLIFHAVSVSWADKKIEKKMRLGETFFWRKGLTRRARSDTSGERLYDNASPAGPGAISR